MKRTFTINLNGIVFHIDEDAYEMMHNYLGKISHHFKSTDEGKEILADIESRIAELFQNRIKEGKEVITDEDVNWMIDIMGKAEEVIGADAENESSQQKNHHGKRFYRDADDKMLGGICSGIANYFNIDPVILRIILVVLFFVSAGTVLIAYFILWFILPEAKTTAQKLEMKGVKVNIENIEKTIKNEFESVKSNFKNIKNSQAGNNFREGIESIFHALGKVFVVFGKSIGIIIGFALLITGLVLLLGLSTSFFGKDWFLGLSQWGITNISFAGLLSFLANPSVSMLAFLGICLVILIPTIGLIYGGIKLLFGIRIKDRVFGGAMASLWVIGFVFLIIAGTSIAHNFQESTTLSSSYKLDKIDSDTLIIKLNDNSMDGEFYFLQTDEVKIGQFGNEKNIYLQTNFSIEKSDLDVAELTIEIESDGKSKAQARKNAQNTVLRWEQHPKGVLLPKYFKLVAGEKWRNQEIDIILNIPISQIIYIDESFEDSYIRTYGNVFEREYDNSGNHYIMTESGLKKL